MSSVHGEKSALARPKRMLSGLLGYAIVIWLALVWTPRLWFWLVDPVKLQELPLQTPRWIILLSIALTIVSLFLVKSTWALIKEALAL